VTAWCVVRVGRPHHWARLAAYRAVRIPDSVWGGPRAERSGRYRDAFGNRPAEIPVEDLREWSDNHEWEAGTYNRYRTVLSGIYRLGMENKKIATNPAPLLKRRQEKDGRIPFLNQFVPDEEATKSHCRQIPRSHPELDIALNTGMRRSE
jgi:hypothetical protein